MQIADALSPRDLARALGVSESTVRRWVDRGALPSRRTRGGHRRIGLADAVEYVRDSGLALDEPSAIGLEVVAQPGSEAADAFHAALREGRDTAAVGMLLGGYVGGRDVAEMCDDWIQPALARIGELWRGATEGILAEHRATAITLAALHRLRALLPERDSLRALGGAIAHDPYAVPSLMAATVLQAEGFAATDLGPDTPAAVIREAIRIHDPHLVWVAVGHVESARATTAELVRLVGDETKTAIPFVLGGRGLPDLALGPRANVHRAASMRELRALAVGLRSSRSA